ncbi:hypothetical protein G6F24_014673 [Rhizopus arrhizus]|nr:hypothetical protein G6F24_014673 [Rhizopus arrhizus]
MRRWARRRSGSAGAWPARGQCRCAAAGRPRTGWDSGRTRTGPGPPAPAVRARGLRLAPEARRWRQARR